MKPVSHLVAYRDSTDDTTLYFGPFVSSSVAQFFKAELPDPLTGGYKRVLSIQPFTHNEGHIVNRKILAGRSLAA